MRYKGKDGESWSIGSTPGNEMGVLFEGKEFKGFITISKVEKGSFGRKIRWM